MAKRSIKWDVTKAEHAVITQIAERAVRLAKQADIPYSVMEATMDVTAAHANGCPLRLDELLYADDANFGHDVFGIRRYLDRSTGRLGHCFVPRFAEPEVKRA